MSKQGLRRPLGEAGFQLIREGQMTIPFWYLQGSENTLFLQVLSHVSLTTALRDRNYYPHLIDEEVEIWKDE